MKNRFLLFAIVAAFVLPQQTWAKKNSNVLDVEESITDNNIIFPESFETDTQALLDGWYMKNYTATDNRYKTEADPNPSDEVIIERLKNMPTIIEMPYNQVIRQCIDRYAKRGRGMVTACLGLANYYLPIIEQALEAEKLPLELKYLPMIESAYNPNAVSRAGATGLWQFMLSAAKGYDMEVNSLVDERRDPFESSKKAAKMLKDLYNTYGKWDLAIAAYNCGPGNVNKALRRAGGDTQKQDFWSIYNYLPSETRSYFPMFVAANYIMTYYQDHNISPVVPTKPLVIDTVAVNARINLNQIAKTLEIPLDELRLLNPQFRSDVIPGSAKRSYMLILPSRQVAAYIMNEEAIKSYDAAKYAQRIVAEPGQLPKESEFEAANDTSNNEDFISEADQFVAQDPEVDDTDADYRQVRESAQKRDQESKATATRQTTVNSKGEIIHKVAAGESLESIAKAYKVSVDQLKIWNAINRNSVRTGQQLVVKGSTNTSTLADDNNNASRRRRRGYASTASQDLETAMPAQKTKASKQQQSADNTQTAQQTSKSTRKAQKQSAKQAKQQQEKQTSYSKKKRNSSNDDNQQYSKKSKKKSNNKKTTEPKNKVHEVKSGESLDVIARKNGVTVEQIRKANRGLKGDVIHPGDKVKIPKSKASKSSKNDNKEKSSKKSSKSKKKKRR